MLLLLLSQCISPLLPSLSLSCFKWGLLAMISAVLHDEGLHACLCVENLAKRQSHKQKSRHQTTEHQHGLECQSGCVHLCSKSPQIVNLCFESRTPWSLLFTAMTQKKRFSTYACVHATSKESRNWGEVEKTTENHQGQDDELEHDLTEIFLTSRLTNLQVLITINPLASGKLERLLQSLTTHSRDLWLKICWLIKFVRTWTYVLAHFAHCKSCTWQELPVVSYYKTQGKITKKSCSSREIPKRKEVTNFLSPRHLRTKLERSGIIHTVVCKPHVQSKQACSSAAVWTAI